MADGTRSDGRGREAGVKKTLRPLPIRDILPSLTSFVGSAVLVVLMMLSSPVRANDLPGWDRTRWGMTSSQIMALYGAYLTRLDAPMVFDGLSAELVLRRASFAGLTFIVYFQMSNTTHRLAQVLLERQRQFATPKDWQATIAALTQAFGPPTARCEDPGRQLEGRPLVVERVWVMPTTTVRASFLDFGGPYVLPQISRRLMVRYAPTRPNEPPCSR